MKEVLKEEVATIRNDVASLVTTTNKLVTSNNTVVETVNKLSSDNLALMEEVKTIKQDVKMVKMSSEKNTESIQKNQSDIARIEKSQKNFQVEIENTLKKIQAEKNAIPLQPSRKRSLSVIGQGDGIGIDRLYHIVVSRIPLNETFDEKWIQSKIEDKIQSISASVKSVELLTSQNPERQNPRSKSFKISISYKGAADDLYNPKFYPKNTRIARYNFPKRRRVSESSAGTTNGNFPAFNNTFSRNWPTRQDYFRQNSMDTGPRPQNQVRF